MATPHTVPGVVFVTESSARYWSSPAETELPSSDAYCERSSTVFANVLAFTGFPEAESTPPATACAFSAYSLV